MISAPMIVRDAERTIRAALESLRGVVDEVVVVDTGSTDRTMDIVREVAAEWDTPSMPANWTENISRPPCPKHPPCEIVCTCNPPEPKRGEPPWPPTLRLLEHPWQNDFSAARNFAQHACTGEWCVVLDADETLAPGDLRAVILAAPDTIDAVAAMVVCRAAGGASRFVARRAYRRARARWMYPAHNQLVGADACVASTAVVSSDYSDGLAGRMARTVPILQRYYVEHPEGRHAPTFLAFMFCANAEFREAQRWAEIAVAICRREPPRPGHVLAFACLIRSQTAGGDIAAASRTLAEGLTRYPAAPDLWHAAAGLYAMQWINVSGAVRGGPWDVGNSHPIGSADVGRIKGALDALEFGLTVGDSPLPIAP